MSVVISLTDVWCAIKKKQFLFYLSALLCASLCCLYTLLQPVCFTAEGIFKGSASQAKLPFSKALEFLGSEEKYASSDDPLTFLLSYPVLEDVVKNLSLQATLFEKNTFKRVDEMGRVLKADQFCRHLSRKRPVARVLGKHVVITDRVVIPDKLTPLKASSVVFNAEISRTLQMTFIDDVTFQVSLGKECLGVGTLNIPFRWSEGHFTLQGEAKKGMEWTLLLLPLEETIASLQETLKVTKDKVNTSLTHITFSHPDRHLAAAIVNETMVQFQNYLQVEGKKKITKQLNYLRQRQEETMDQLEGIMEKHRIYLEDHLDAGEMITLEKELDFMAQRQAAQQQNKQDLIAEMEHLAQALGLKETFSDLVEYLKGHVGRLPLLTVEAARSLVNHHTHQLDTLQLNHEKYDYCLSKLLDTHFDSSSLSKILDDESLRPRFEKMHALHRFMMDEKNWTEKERFQHKKDLETEKQFMVQHINYLKEGALLESRVLKERVRALQEDLLFLLFDQYVKAEDALLDLTTQALHFPKKWLTEQKIELNTKMYSEIMESITKMIEAKNIGYNLDYLLSTPLKIAQPPVIPNPPHVFLSLLVGALAGLVGCLMGICFHESWQGPSASYENLVSAGRSVLVAKELLPHLGYILAQSGPLILLTGRHPTPLYYEIAEWVKNYGERVFLLDLTTDLPEIFGGTEKEFFLASIRFSALLNTLKEDYDKILIISTQLADSFETKLLTAKADKTIYAVYGERLKELDSLPAHTLFFHPPQVSQPISLLGVIPILNRLLTRKTIASFSFLKSWKQSLSKKT